MFDVKMSLFILFKHRAFDFKTLINGVAWIIVMCLSAVWTQSEGTHSLVNKGCNATFLMHIFNKLT